MRTVDDNTRIMFISAFVLFSVFCAAYWIPLSSIVSTWLENDDYSYGFFIPVISLYLLWDMRLRLDGMHIRASWAVLPVLLLFVLLSVYGILGSSGNISMPSIPILIASFAAFCFGADLVRRFVLPFAFLVFMVPIPAVFERTLGMYLKAVSSKLGGKIIELFNISVHVSGNIIDLGVTQLQVVDACNGLRYLFPLFALGIIYAYFFERIRWKQIFCVLATLPIAVLTNALRIGITGVLTDRFGPEVAQGFFHDFSGWVLFMAAFFMLFLMGRVLALFPPKGNKSVDSPLSEAKPGGIPQVDRAGVMKALAVSFVILAVVGGLSLSTKALPPIKLKGGIAGFPLSFQGWSGKSSLVDPEIIDKSGAEEAFNARYRNTGGDEVSLYMGYRSTAFLANENYFHSPTVCLPSSGWKTLEESTRLISGIPFWNEIKVSRMVMSYLDEKAVVYFWFQTKNKASNDKNINRFDLAMHAVRRDNTHALFMRTITTVRPGEQAQDGEKRMAAFIRDMMPVLQRYLEENRIRGH